ERPDSGNRVPGRAAGRPGSLAAADLGPQDPDHLHRRRYAQPDVGRGAGAPDVGPAHLAAAGAG
nr:hypothetical protein [Tanacetum cinerariifolium]